ncbi:MAG: DUF503 domain-containing protein [Candidatus Sumerlaeia bacterium]|nr:DUF503 domain-containing protein [Candidatus Sumerlaeia bacterium]
MHILLARYHLRLEHAQSLKEKRGHLKRLIAALQSRHNIAIAESDHHDLWHDAEISVVTLSLQKEVAEATERAIAETLERDSDFVLGEWQLEWL